MREPPQLPRAEIASNRCSTTTFRGLGTTAGQEARQTVSSPWLRLQSCPCRKATSSSKCSTATSQALGTRSGPVAHRTVSWQVRHWEDSPLSPRAEIASSRCSTATSRAPDTRFGQVAHRTASRQARNLPSLFRPRFPSSSRLATTLIPGPDTTVDQEARRTVSSPSCSWQPRTSECRCRYSQMHLQSLYQFLSKYE
jgi:hypothetical protein